MHEWVHCHDEAANHQLPIAVAFWVIQIVSVEERSSLTQNLMPILCSAHSVILNATDTQYTRSLNSVYHPHRLVQWSRQCSCMCIVVHSPWLPGYIDVTQTVLVLCVWIWERERNIHQCARGDAPTKTVTAARVTELILAYSQNLHHLPQAFLHWKYSASVSKHWNKR